MKPDCKDCREDFLFGKNAAIIPFVKLSGIASEERKSYGNCGPSAKKLHTQSEGGHAMTLTIIFCFVFGTHHLPGGLGGGKIIEKELLTDYAYSAYTYAQ